MKPLLKAALLLPALLLPPAAARAWGPTGHRVVGRIAEHHLCEEAARAVDALIGPQTLAQVATWPDEIRSDPAWKKADPWHFISIDDGETLETTAREPAGDLVEAIERFTATLRDPAASREDRAVALRFLVHLVGDVHQPLHVGRRADHGGNSIVVTWFGAGSNLHRVWDADIIDHDRLSFSELAAFLDHPTLTEVRDWQAAPLADWVRESQDLRPRVYAIGDGKLSYDYEFRNYPVIRLRLLQAGVRLAGLLDSIFAQPGPSLPPPPP